ncbi:hypothetical protein DFH09DRAFT_1386775 [Mycena vulgaris]|nr:hypothetical protein DFH09DRAFT_1386775 [Mycena vulgaris]
MLPFSFVLSLCFVSFLMGQVFNTVLTSFSTPLEAKSVDLVSSGADYSLMTVIVVVLSVLAAHDVLIALIIRRLLMSPEPALKRILKLLLTAADDPVERLALVLFRLARVNVPVAAAARNNHVGNWWMSVSNPRLFRASSYKAGVTFMDAASRVRYLQLDILRLLLALATASRAHQHDMDDICYATIEEVPDTTGSFVEVASSEELNTDIPISLSRLSGSQRTSNCCTTLPLLSSAPPSPSGCCRALKNAQAQDLLSLATRSRDTSETLVVEVVPDAVSSWERDCRQASSPGPFLPPASPPTSRYCGNAEKVMRPDRELMNCHDAEDTVVEGGQSGVEKMETVAVVEDLPACTTIDVGDTTDTFVADGVSVIEEKKLDVVIVEQDPAPTYQELDWDSAPSYEEFVNGAPSEPLFERRFIALDHALILEHRGFHFSLGFPRVWAMFPVPHEPVLVCPPPTASLSPALRRHPLNTKHTREGMGRLAADRGRLAADTPRHRSRNRHPQDPTTWTHLVFLLMSLAATFAFGFGVLFGDDVGAGGWVVLMGMDGPGHSMGSVLCTHSIVRLSNVLPSLPHHQFPYLVDGVFEPADDVAADLVSRRSIQALRFAGT